ncbi:hypothetical protein CSB93_0426 [Pseudomonas paraeruginosa]|uniref:Uncharacterized protein n=1 Tax=Pseudomonas paraeruginosa TaxID=2994495 RepID=A0A2R3IRA1_9PSED|nr:hypothetical protein CSB93_0426 [Pseudomonas paraeruginosa]AWE90791.1 hypothetical protein CSC28_5739 [Pseudomonas paraeruginosa]PTC34064.1 hypothetical protein CLJ1_5272 [Pseudomonas aeruginosa]
MEKALPYAPARRPANAQKVAGDSLPQARPERSRRLRSR